MRDDSNKIGAQEDSPFMQQLEGQRQSPKAIAAQTFLLCGVILWMATQTLGTGRLAFIPTWVVLSLAGPFFFGGIFLLLPKSTPPLPASKKVLFLLMALTAIAPIVWVAIYTNLPLILRIFMLLPIAGIFPLAIWSYSLNHRQKAAAAKKAIETDDRFIPKDKKW
jgi:hypothetical protein